MGWSRVEWGGIVLSATKEIHRSFCSVTIIKKHGDAGGGGVEGNARSIRHVKNALFRSQPWSRVVNSTAPFSAIYPFSALKTACYDIILQS